eukprot:5375420-Prymnesium_polylepis.1
MPTHEHSKRSLEASSRCSRWPYRPSAQLGQAHRMNGEPGRWCCGVASATPRCRFDFESRLVPANAWSGDHRQRSLTPDTSSPTGEQVIFVESSSSTMLEAEGSRPRSHLAQGRTAQQASVACTSSGRTPPPPVQSSVVWSEASLY